MNKIFALDLGTNSIGWALRNPDLTENQIEKFGVLTFNKGVGLGKTGEYSYAAERTKKRSTRRLYQSRKYRIWATLEHLIFEGYCPLSIEDLNKWRHYSKEEAVKNNNAGRVYPVDNLAFDAWIKLDFNNNGKPEYTSPYQLRKELAEVKLDFTNEENRYKLGRALYHIAQRRGFKSSRKGADGVKEKEEFGDNEIELQYSEKKKSKRLKELFPDFDASLPVGVFLANKEVEGYRVRLDITQYLVREDYKNEIKYIFQLQELGFEHSLFMKLVESGKNKNDGSIFYKRPLRSQKGLIGKCTLEINKYRAPVSHPSFETFRAWSFLNNIKYKPVNDKDAYWQLLPLDLKERIYADKFFRKSKVYFPFSEIADFIKKEGNNWLLNYSLKTTVTGCPVSARLKDIFSDDYLNIQIPKEKAPNSEKAYYDIEDIWHVLFNYEDQEYVSEFAIEKVKLNEAQVKQFVIAWNALPVGYGMLSLNAINKINKFLEKGLIYTEAVLLANIPSLIGKELWASNEQFFLENISKLIDENRRQKTILNIVNNLVSQHKNLEQKFGFKDGTYLLDDTDKQDIQKAIEEAFGKKKWQEKDDAENEQIRNIVTDCYQAYFKTSGLTRKDINGERHFEIRSGNQYYYKTDSGYYRLPKLIDTLSEFLQVHFEVTDMQLLSLYHPSEINIYPPAKPDKDGVLKLGSPKTGSFKNPMAMRTMHELRKLMNYMIETNQIDSDTRIVVEVARELNDSNKRWAIEAWQRQREAENQEFAQAIEQLINVVPSIGANTKSEQDIDKMRLWYEQNDEETVPPITDAKKDIKGIKWSENIKPSYKQIIAQKTLIDKYRLWKEQECQCIYTGKIISIADLFNDNVIDFEHTVPRSKSFDNSLANLTVCFADFNRTVKKNQIPFTLNCYSDILKRIAKWQEKVERIKQQIDFWKTKSKKAVDKQWKDDAIRQRHLWQMELDYWKNKVDRFTIEEITSGFKNSQKVDTQLISKYALHYLKTYFEKVDVQKGSVTAEFRKIYKLQVPDEKKDRSKHSHHAKDAAVLTLIPIAAKRDAILEKYYESKENKTPFTETEPYKGFKREFVWGIDDTVLINNITNGQTLTPAKRKIRKRGKEQFIKGTNQPMWATGDSIRGQLHDDTFFGAIKPAIRGENGHILKDKDGNFIQEERTRFVVRVPFIFKKDTNSPGFKTLDDIENQIVDEGLKKQIKSQVEKANSFKDAMEQGIYMVKKNGEKVNKIRHIRIFKAISEPLKIKRQTNLSKTNYKQFYYANNATNSYFAIYEDDKVIDFKYINLFETSKIVSSVGINTEFDLFEKTILKIKAKKTLELKLKYILKAGLKVLFLKDNETIDEIMNFTSKEISNRLYVYNRFKKNGEGSAKIFLKHHLEARKEEIIDAEIRERFSQKDSEVSTIDFENPIPKVALTYSKYKFILEETDFRINMDGTISWLK